jgi:hypothetical protein
MNANDIINNYKKFKLEEQARDDDKDVYVYEDDVEFFITNILDPLAAVELKKWTNWNDFIFNCFDKIIVTLSGLDDIINGIINLMDLLEEVNVNDYDLDNWSSIFFNICNNSEYKVKLAIRAYLESKNKKHEIFSLFKMEVVHDSQIEFIKNMNEFESLHMNDPIPNINLAIRDDYDYEYDDEPLSEEPIQKKKKIDGTVLYSNSKLPPRFSSLPNERSDNADISIASAKRKLEFTGGKYKHIKTKKRKIRSKKRKTRSKK